MVSDTTLKLFYSEKQALALPEGHTFPAVKYPGLIDKLEQTDWVNLVQLIPSEPATLAQLLNVHHPDYVQRMVEGWMTPREMRRIGFPWSGALVQRSLLSVGATIAACKTCLKEGLAVNLGGGTHHAYPDHGEGYCVFNDVAVAIRTIQGVDPLGQVLIIDCDVHQGNGTAAIFAGEDSVFTFSIHGDKNFPFRKERSDLDISLPDWTEDELYLENLETGLDKILSQMSIDLAVYIAGADPFEGDRLGRLCISKRGLAIRDHIVIDRCREMGIPLAMVMGGGYAKNIDDTVEIHLQSLRIAVDRVRKEGLQSA